ncbi:hypothetical protein LPC08_01760 [Roseomonas sp. OT10]|uniref:hypothetical protein n=1 Tax=Roseomonas cutis TaxID=2897332 RepID=UPI001E29537A|nr:hypothetical protein [Roseomonas sp. OT10]UFN49397.1 hypothetical protein LPC08_01760 [Roseomonas sp. OT10]
MSAPTPTPRRRSLLGHLAGATAATVLVRSCTTLGDAPAAEAPSPTLSAYRAVMAQLPLNDRPDAEVEAWCDAEIAAIQALADEPGGGLADLLRKVVLLGDRCAGDGDWRLMDCEMDLIAAVRDQAAALLAQR